MKKSILAVALALGTFTVTNAQVDQEAMALRQSQSEKVEVQKEKAAATLSEAQDFKAIKVEDLPQAVKASVAKDFEGATISEAAVNDKGVYKVVVATADSKSQTLYANAKGEWIKKG